MKKFFSQIVSLILVFAFLLQCSPLPVFASSNVDNTDSVTAIEESEYVTVPAKVIGETEDLRNESEKHFRLSDGTSLLISYGSPVHYKDENGDWQDIDNTLGLSREENTYRTNKNGDSIFFLAADLSEGRLADVSWKDHSVSFELLSSDDRQELCSNREANNTDDALNNAPLCIPDYDHDVTIEIQEKTQTDRGDSNGWSASDLVPEKLTSKVIYKDVYPGVDIGYTLHGYDLKEEIIVNKKQDTYRFDFKLSLRGLNAVLKEDGSIALEDEKGECIYLIPAPYMVDSNGAASGEAKYILSELKDGAVVLSVIADPSWINDEERAFPVIIDPTLFAQASNNVYGSSANIYATYSLSYYPAQAIASWGLPQHLFIGFEPSSGHTRGYFHFHNLPTVPSGCDVIGAYFDMYVFDPYTDGYTGYYSNNCSQLPLELREVTTERPSGYSSYYDWIYGISWNNQPSVSGNPILDYTVAGAGSVGQYLGWDITGLVKKWYCEGTENRTVAIIPTEESSHSSSYYGCIRTLAYGDTYPPMLIIAYRNTEGLEPYYTYTALDVGLAGIAYIADGTGQLKVTVNAASYHSELLPVSVDLVYNSDHFKNSNSSAYSPYAPEMDFGSGWTIDCVQSLSSTVIENTQYLKYTDGDGTEHYFLKDLEKDPSSTYYYDEDGLGLKIRSVSAGYEMSDDKDAKYVFSAGKLISITNANGSKISFTYSSGQITGIGLYDNTLSGYNVCSFSYENNRLTSIDASSGDISLSYLDGKLISISKGNVPIAGYEYSGQRLSKMTDLESGYSLNFVYDANGRVCEYCESAGNETGAMYSVAYPNDSQTLYRSFGNDRIENTSDDLLTYYLFDYAGRTVNAYSTDAGGELLGASNAVYTGYGSTDKANNRTLRTASMGESGDELLTNSIISSSSGWTLGSGVSIDTQVSRDETGGSIKIDGQWNAERNAYQDVLLNASATDTYMLSGWAIANSVPNTNLLEEDPAADTFKQFGLKAVIYYSDNTTESHFASFYPDLDQWQFISMAIVPKEPSKTVQKIRVYAVYEKNANTAYFDNLSLIQESCQTMRYDDDGNLVSVKTTGLSEQTNTYSSGNLIQAVTGGYGTYSYTYDNNHNLTSVTDGSVSEDITYSARGNVIKTTLTGGDLVMESSAGYTNFGNLLYSETDSAANTITYNYGYGLSTALGLPVRIIDGRGTTHIYQYDGFGRLIANGVTGYSSLGYTYSDGNLAGISRTSGGSTQNYYLGYDPFGNLTSLSAGNKTLGSYTYAQGNGNLTRETYGNGKYVDFVYDNRERVTSWTDSDGNSRSYLYGLDGNVSSITGSDGSSISLSYDGLDRLNSYSLSKNNNTVLSFNRNFNIYGQTVSRSWTLGGSSYAQGFTYNNTANDSVPDGLLTSMGTGTGDTLNYSYDGLGRLVSVNGPLTKSYTYRDLQNGKTTGQVSGYETSFGNSALLSSSYTYDGNGNISSETVGNNTFVYTYDALDQLTGASDGTTVYSYTYDGAGNILSYSNGTGTHTYGYSDADWKDLLTSFDGHTISYDGAGNPLSYYNGREWDFEWNAGNTLGSAENLLGNTETNISYEYDLDRIRTEKTVTYRTYHTHSYEVSSVISPTCTEDGYTIEECSCGNTRNTNYVSALGHSYVDTVVAPTCTEQGYTLHTCSRCGDEYESDYIQATGHNYVDTVVPPTCTLQGYTKHICSDCGDETRTDYVPALGHIWGIPSGNIQTCIRCGATNILIPVDPRPGLETEGVGDDPDTYDCLDGEIDNSSCDTEEISIIAEDLLEPEEPVIRSGEPVLELEVTASYDYVYAGNKLLREVVTTNGVSETHDFFYDDKGLPFAIKIDNVLYYYVTNLQGDVLGLVDTNGSLVASYTYDPYGKVLTATGSLAEKNPLRYRSYYYDQETGLYYVSSRYYDPEICRWINADDVSYLGAGGDVLSYNLFAYCLNNPVNMTDESGALPSWAKKIIAAAVIVTTVTIATVITVATAGTGTVAAFIVGGAAKGAVIGMLSGAVTGAASSAIKHRLQTGSWESSGEAALNGMGDGALYGTITGTITGAVSSGIKVAKAARAWDSGTFKSGYDSMKYHYNKHVLKEGYSHGNNIVKYTNDALNFINRNSSTLKYTYNFAYGNTSWNSVYTTGQGGMFTTIGKIITFWYK